VARFEHQATSARRHCLEKGAKGFDDAVTERPSEWEGPLRTLIH